MTAIKTRKTVLLEDSPVEIDAFSASSEIGPHHRLASAVSTMISEEEGGRMIGLEGGWGSGKSTVISIVRKNLESNSRISTATIIFDAWAHEGDPLRRTFLESIVKGLNSAGWIDKDSWSRTLDQIANRRRESETTTTTKPTVLAYFFAIALLLVPMGTALVGAAFKEGVRLTLDPEGELSRPFTLGVLLAFAPLWVLVGNLLRLLWYKVWRKQVPPEFWSFSGSQGQVTTKSSTQESQNPTSLEFEKHFETLMAEALLAKTKPERRLLLILDNLDRVDHELALQLWSTLQTFLQSTSSRSQPWFKRLWVVVPFDPSGLRKLWDNRDAKAPNSPETGSTGNPEIEDTVASDSFLDKSFQVRFLVPPLMLSNWKQFLYQCVEKALPEHTREEVHEIFQVYNQFAKPEVSQSPTPRQLKLYVNQIGAVVRQWGDSVPVGHVAYFVLQSQNGHPLIQKLRNASLPCQKGKRLLSEKLTESLAGLLFNTTPQRGLELLLAQPIQMALASAKHDDLLNLFTNHGDGFWSVFEQVVLTKWSEVEAHTLCEIAICLQNSKLLHSTRPEVKTAIDELKRTALTLDKWSPIDRRKGEGIAALCKSVSSQDFTDTLVGSLAKGTENPSGRADYVEVTVEGIAQMLADVEAAAQTILSDARFILPEGNEQWVSHCVEIEKSPVAKKYCQHFLLRSEPQELVDYLSAGIDAGKASDAMLQVVTVSQSIALEVNWQRVLDSIRNRLDPGQSPTQQECETMLNLLLCFQRLRVNACEPAITAVSEGIVLSHLHTYRKQKAIKSLCLYFYLKHDPKAATPPSPVGSSDVGFSMVGTLLSQPDEPLIENLGKLLLEQKDSEFLEMLLSERPSVDQLVDELIGWIASETEHHFLFTLSILRNHWTLIDEAMGVSEGDQTHGAGIELLRKIASQVWTEIASKEIEMEPNDHHFFLALLKATPENRELLAWCEKKLKLFSKEEWLSDFSNGYGFTSILIHLSEAGIPLSFNSEYSDAILEHAKRIASHQNSSIPEGVRTNWAKVVGALGIGGVKKTLQEKLLDVAIEFSDSLSVAFLDLYGNEISAEDILLQNQRTVSHLWSSMLTNRNLAGLTWIRQILQGNPSILDRVETDQHVEDFEDRLLIALQNPTQDDSQKEVEVIASILDVSIPTIDAQSAEAN